MGGNIKHNPIMWSMWANVLGVYAGGFLLLGGILAQFEFDGYRQAIGMYSIVMGPIVEFLEWPRGNRKKGRTIPRQYQQKIQPIVGKLGGVYSNYYVRSVLWLLVAIPSCFSLPTILGGVTLVFAAIVYFVGSIKGESWAPITESSRSKRPKISEAPQKAPPRRPDVASPVTQREEPEAQPQRLVPRRPTAAPRPTMAPSVSRPQRPIIPQHNPKDEFKDYAWRAATDRDTGDTYYYNEDTNETSWEKPPKWDAYVKIYGDEVEA